MKLTGIILLNAATAQVLDYFYSSEPLEDVVTAGHDETIF
jgi:hypothetical protein